MALRNNISLADEDHEEKNNSCAIVYGSLPPTTKKEQARMFNEREGNIQFLAATDAVGMGLNFNIQRIIFYSVKKLDYEELRKTGRVQK
jgi:ATP-dependent RNA helicase SUPV3L1/SUV3